NVFDHMVEAITAPQDSRDPSLIVGAAIGTFGEERRAQADGIYGAAQVMSQHAKEAVAVLGLALEKGGDDFRDTLVDGFAESDDLPGLLAETLGTGIEAQRAGAHGAIYRNDLCEVEARFDAGADMVCGDPGERIAQVVPLALGGLLVRALRCLHVVSDGLEDRDDIVEQGSSGHAAGGGRAA